MNLPAQALPIKPNDPMLGGKYRMNNIRRFIALLYLIFIANGKKSRVSYSNGQQQESSLSLKKEIESFISSFLNISDVSSFLVNNPLLMGQFEYILVALERLFKLGTVEFNDKSFSNSKERVGKIRYPKTIIFSSNMIVLDLILSSLQQDKVKESIKEWLANKPSSFSDFEIKVCTFLTTLTQDCLFKIRQEGREIVFRPIGIYCELLQNGEVRFEDEREIVGTASIYKNFISENLDPWVVLHTNTISSNERTDIIDLSDYSDMVETLLHISPIAISEKSYSNLQNSKIEVVHNIFLKYRPLITAIKTKPFLLLAGISGTGKSRIVRELAFKSCPKFLQDKEGTTPGNYCMIEVKPNWHDSTELLGYYSRLGKGGYQFTKFVNFLVKAKMFPEVPFFVCLDEMNLAPVEQYFAEILSILETRKHPKDNKKVISTGTIIDAKYFQELGQIDYSRNIVSGESYNHNLADRDIYMKLFNIDTEEDIKAEIGNKTDLSTIGLTLPDNVVIIGTVNMDDTTHQFSRKVIDRAMTIEMNGGNLRDMFGGSKDLEYIEDEAEQQKWQYAFAQRYVTADEVLEAHQEYAQSLKEKLPARLEEINEALKGTPFEVSYRVLNELTIMVGVLIDDKKATDEDVVLDDIINQALNNILLMKILPRIEGDAEMFALSNEYQKKMNVKYANRLEWLKALAPELVSETETHETDEDDSDSIDESTEVKSKAKKQQYTAKDKIKEMIERLDSQEFTRFWP